MRVLSLLAALPLVLVLSRCGSDDGGDAKPKPDAGTDAEADAGDAAGDGAGDAGDAGQSLPDAFARYCTGKSWRETFSPATIGMSSGQYVGVLNTDFAEGIQEATKLVPEHPFAAKSIQVGFGKGSGKARLRLMRTFGRSYPASFAQSDWPDYSEPIDLIPPVEIEVTNASKDAWQEVPIPETLLMPTEHYMLVYEHLGAEPRLAVEKVATGDVGRSLVFDPSQPSSPPTGFDGNYRLRLGGDHFCQWSDAERWFERQDKAFGDTIGSWAAWADLDGDGHDDAVFTTSKGPVAFKGDGKGAFSALSGPFSPDTPNANFFVFGDLDNDGDLDAFGSQYVQTDADGDGVAVDQDCNDAEAKVKPGASELPGNGFDDDCDGKADDGTSTADADADGMSIAAGDCDDTRAETKLGAKEIPDSRDNDCDGKTDEDFFPKLLKNDGTGQLSWSASADVESLGPSSAAALGDGNGDGLLDLYSGYWLVHYPDSPTVPSRYYEGQTGVTMSWASAKVGISQNPWRPVYGVLWTDWNDDALLDVYVSNYQLSANLLWKNQGAGKFEEVAVVANAAADDVPMFGYNGGHSFGSDAGDIDNDGDIDIYVPNISHPRVQPGSDPSMLLVNGGAPNFVFENKRRELGLIYDEGDVEASFADYDNDGDLDLLVISTYPSHYPRLYRNDLPKGFTDVTYEAHAHLHQAQTGLWSDVDEDGDLDLLLLSPGPGPRMLLLRNKGTPGNHFLELDLRGTSSNRSAIGARVYVTSGGVTRIREVQSQSRHPSSRWVHVGLGASTSIDKLEVRWPNGSKESISGASADKRWRVVEGSGQAVAP